MIHSLPIVVPIGMTLANCGQRTDGVVVLELEPGYPAHRAGLLVGDIVQKVGAVDTVRFEDLRAVLNGQVGETVELSILRGGEPKTVSVTIEEKTTTRC